MSPLPGDRDNAQPISTQDLFAALQDLCGLTPTRHPARPLPAAVQCLLPDPMHSADELARWQHRDVPTLSREELWCELQSIRAALGLCSDDIGVPPWLLQRLRLLTARAREAAA